MRARTKEGAKLIFVSHFFEKRKQDTFVQVQLYSASACVFRPHCLINL